MLGLGSIALNPKPLDIQGPGRVWVVLGSALRRLTDVSRVRSRLGQLKLVLKGFRA